MKISELADFIKEERFDNNAPIEILVGRLIDRDKIDDFLPIMASYIIKLQEKREYNKCELIESATLLHFRRIGLNFEGQRERELHVINKHSSLSCKKENTEEEYNAEKSEEEFKKIYNL